MSTTKSVSVSEALVELVRVLENLEVHHDRYYKYLSAKETYQVLKVIYDYAIAEIERLSEQ